MSEPSYYDLLGLSRGATADEIRLAYRARLKESHPDLAVDEADRVAREARTKQLVEAHEVLIDPLERADYDHWLDDTGFSWRLLWLRVAGAALLRLRGRHRLGFGPRLLGRASSLSVGLVTLAVLLRDTRLGQWLLVLMALVGGLGLGPAVGVPAGGAALVGASAAALLLARRGSPTPLYDAARLMTPLGNAAVAAALRAVSVASGAATSRGGSAPGSLRGTLEGD